LGNCYDEEHNITAAIIEYEKASPIIKKIQPNKLQPDSIEAARILRGQIDQLSIEYHQILLKYDFQINIMMK
jgi:hypothetical protein